MRLPRPYIPLDVRCRIGARQIGWGENAKDGQEAAINSLLRLHAPIRRHGHKGTSGYARLLRNILAELATKLSCCPQDLRLDHDPPIALRVKVRSRGKIIGYLPDANDPEFLSYRPHGAQFAGSHDVKTRIRGDHGQYSDVTLIKRQRRRERGKKESARKLRSRPFPKPKQKKPWPKRKFPRKK